MPKTLDVWNQRALLKEPDLPGGETLFGADHPSSINQGSSTEVVSFSAHTQVRGYIQHSRKPFTITVKHHQLSDSPVSQAHRPRWVPRNPIHYAHYGTRMGPVFSLSTLTKLHVFCDHKKVTQYCKTYFADVWNILESLLN